MGKRISIYTRGIRVSICMYFYLNDVLFLAMKIINYCFIFLSIVFYITTKTNIIHHWIQKTHCSLYLNKNTYFKTHLCIIGIWLHRPFHYQWIGAQNKWIFVSLAVILYSHLNNWPRCFNSFFLSRSSYIQTKLLL